MAHRDMIKTAGRVKGCIDRRYAMETTEVMQLMEMAQDDIATALLTAFHYGYVMGGRAAKAGKYRERSRAADPGAIRQPAGRDNRRAEA